MTIFGADIQAVLPIIGAVIALGYAWRESIRSNRLMRRMAHWLVQNRREEWESQSFLTKRMIRPAIKRLGRKAAEGDAEFRTWYEQAMRHERDKAIFALLGGALLGVVILGSKFWGWSLG